MNKYIRDGLNGVQVCDVPPFDENTTHIVIPKKNSYKSTQMQTGCCYIIEIEDYMIDNGATFNYHNEWNCGQKPTNKYYKCECVRIVGTNIKINGVGYDYPNDKDTTDLWEGWLPIKAIKVIGRL